MRNKTLAWLALLVLAQALSGCGGTNSSPTPLGPSPTAAPAPTPTPAAPPAAGLFVYNVSPNLGATGGGTPVLISGSGFEPGAAVTLGGSATDVTVLSSTALIATTPPHPPGAVDVVVINPSGQRGLRTGGYTYAVIDEGPRPSITAISPNIGTVGGGSFLTIAGVGFERGAIVKLDNTALPTHPFNSDSTTLHATASPHAAGSIDVMVINPDGQIATLTRGYTYAPPGALHFSGHWQGIAGDVKDDHGSTKISFTIENNTLTSVSCNDETRQLPPRPIADDAFDLSFEDGVHVSGRFLSQMEAVGKISFLQCGLTWAARRQ